MTLSCRAFQLDDIEKIVDYFINSSTDFLIGMGADKSKFPTREEWINKLRLELEKPHVQKEYYYVIWEINQRPVGHANINNIEFGKSATMHLHIWDNKNRKNGFGLKFLKQTLPFFFDQFELKKLICKPYSENAAPNKTLKKLGFDFIRRYETTPGAINYCQFVNQYELTKTTFEEKIRSSH